MMKVIHVILFAQKKSTPAYEPKNWTVGYGVSHIKLFLKVTKFARNVQMINYFPDLLTSFMSERKFCIESIFLFSFREQYPFSFT